TTTFGNTTVRAPIVAPAPTLTNGPIETSAPKQASGATELSRSIPGAGRRAATKNDSARANDAYGLRERSSAHDGGAAVRATSGATSTADARVAFNWSRYFGLLRNDRSPGCACW